MTSSRRNTDPDVDDAQLSALVQLRLLPSLPDERLIQLLSCYQPKSIIDNASPELIGPRAFAALNTRKVRERTERALEMIAKRGVSVVSIRDDAYPAPLRCLEKFAPPVLFWRGRTELFDSRCIAVIGARDSTEYGDSVAELFATDLARRDVVVISGLARGIDAIAHESALRAGGSTIAVLGCGIDVHYPPRNARLQERIAEEGLLISEFAPASAAYPMNFPQRNRIIALLSSGVLVIEAGVKSGTLKTVEWAISYGVEVFAVPGPIGRHESQGTNEIIRDGGHIVLSIRDLFEGLHWSFGDVSDSASDDAGEFVSMDPIARAVYSRVTTTGVHVDTIARRAGLSVPETLTQLMQLELDGVIVQHAGMRFVRVLRK